MQLPIGVLLIPDRMRSGEVEVDLDGGGCFRLPARLSNRGNTNRGDIVSPEGRSRRSSTPWGCLYSIALASSFRSYDHLGRSATCGLPPARLRRGLASAKDITRTSEFVNPMGEDEQRDGPFVAQRAAGRKEFCLYGCEIEVFPRSGRRALDEGSSSSPKRRTATPRRAVTSYSRKEDMLTG